MTERTIEPIFGQNPSGTGLEELVDLGPEMFSDVSGTVISYQGENFYKACGEFVMQYPDGQRTSCVYPARFPHDNHLDYRGTTTEREDETYVSLSAVPRSQEELDRVSRAMRRAFKSLTAHGIQTSISMLPPGGDGS